MGAGDRRALDNAAVTLERVLLAARHLLSDGLNQSETRQKATVTLTALAQPSTCRDLVQGTEVTWRDKRTDIELDADVSACWRSKGRT